MLLPFFQHKVATFEAATDLRVWVASGAATPAELNPADVGIDLLGSLVAPVLTAQHRLALLAAQGLCLADDRVHQALQLIASSCQNV